MPSIRAHYTGKLFFDFRYRGVRCREYTQLDDTPKNRQVMMRALKKIEAEILVGTFDYAKTFPNSRNAERFSQPPAPMDTHTGAGHVDTSDHPTLQEFGETWFAENEPMWKPSYRTKLRDIFTQRLIPEFGHKRVGDIQKSVPRHSEWNRVSV